MTEGVLVAGAEARGQRLSFGILAALLLAAAAGLLFVPQASLIGSGLAVAALAMLAVSESVAAYRRRARRWVTDTGSGFRWSDGVRDVTVAAGHVTAVRLAHERKFSQGLLKSVIRRWDVWTDESRPPLRMATRLRPGEADPLQALIERVIDDLKIRSARGLMQGTPLQGDAFSLSSQELVLFEGRKQRRVPFASLESIGQFDGKLCLWCRGQDEPVAKIDPGSRNAPVLKALVGAWMERQAATNAVAQSAEPAAAADGRVSGLGRLLFERRGRMAPTLPSLLLVVAGAVSVIAFISRNLALGGSLAGVALGMLVWALAWSRTVFRCHERGVLRRTYQRATRIAYVDMTEFTFGATRFYYHGVYTGTQLSMIFRSPLQYVRYATTVRNLDADLDSLRDHIAKVIAARMLDRLQQGQPVPWTPALTLRPNELEFRPQGFLRKSSAQTIAYDQIRAADVHKGRFYVWSTTAKKPVFQTDVSRPNFFPGFYALLAQMQAAQRP